MKKVKKYSKILLFTAILSVSSLSVFAAAAQDMASQIQSHGGLYTSTTTYTQVGPIMVIQIVYYCNDGTALKTGDWYLNL